MRLSGATTVPAPPDLVRAALTDPEVLAAAIPGCEQFQRREPDGYRFTVTGRVAAIESSFSGQIRLEPERTPASLLFSVSCAGQGGTVSATVHVRLTADAEGLTQVSYNADADVSGPLASVGQLLLAESAKRFAADLLSRIALPERSHAQRGQSPAAGPGPVALRPVVPVSLPAEARRSFALGVVAGAAIALAAVVAGSRCGRPAR